MHKVLIFIILIAVFILGFWSSQRFLTSTWENIKRQLPSYIVNNNIIQQTGCDEACQKQIQDEVRKAVATISASPKASGRSATPLPTRQTQFISLDSLYSTRSTSWTDVPGTDVTFDIAKDYSSKSTVSWQAALKVANANGQAFARLFDVTHGMAVSGSEISTVNNADFQTAYSGNLNLWSGSINYRVQIKSLNSFEVSYIGGKIKIVY